MARATITRKIEIYDPSALPAWVPAPGAVADVSLNTMLNVADGLLVSAARAWSGMGYAPWYGSLGSFVLQGGGHSDGAENTVFRYDIATRMFSIIKYPAPIFHSVVDNYVADPVTGWMWGDVNESSVQVGEPFTSHFYSWLLCVPPSSMPGSTNGWFFTPGRGSMPEGAQRGTNQAHRLALGTEKWEAYGAPVPNPPEHGCTIYDPTRNRVITLRESQESATTTHGWFDLSDGSSGVYTTGSSIRAHYAIGAYHAADDCYMMIRFDGSALTFRVITAATGAVTTPTVSGTAPEETREGAFDWVEEWNAWVYYPGIGNHIYTLKCAGDPRTDTWTWGQQTVTGTARPTDGTGAGTPYNRLRLCRGLGAETGVVLWLAGSTDKVQAFRITPP